MKKAVMFLALLLFFSVAAYAPASGAVSGVTTTGKTITLPVSSAATSTPAIVTPLPVSPQPAPTNYFYFSEILKADGTSIQTFTQANPTYHFSNPEPFMLKIQGIDPTKPLYISSGALSCDKIEYLLDSTLTNFKGTFTENATAAGRITGEYTGEGLSSAWSVASGFISGVWQGLNSEETKTASVDQLKELQVLPTKQNSAYISLNAEENIPLNKSFFIPKEMLSKEMYLRVMQVEGKPAAEWDRTVSFFACQKPSATQKPNQARIDIKFGGVPEISCSSLLECMARIDCKFVNAIFGKNLNCSAAAAAPQPGQPQVEPVAEEPTTPPAAEEPAIAAAVVETAPGTAAAEPTVTAGEAASCELSPNPVEIAPNGEQKLEAICHDSSGVNVACPELVWLTFIGGASVNPVFHAESSTLTAGATEGEGIVRATALNKENDETLFECESKVIITGAPVATSEFTAGEQKLIDNAAALGLCGKQYSEELMRQATFSTEVKALMLGLMIQESSCRPAEIKGTSYGLMQINANADGISGEFKECKDRGIIPSTAGIDAAADYASTDKEKWKYNIACGLYWMITKYSYRALPTTGCGAQIPENKYLNRISNQKQYFFSDSSLTPYAGWDAALRRYQGLACTNVNYDREYVEKVHAYANAVLTGVAPSQDPHTLGLNRSPTGEE
ncbi:MAG: hypothetical protein V1494_06740 [Candidatus Diapherotrites archaeon]